MHFRKVKSFISTQEIRRKDLDAINTLYIHFSEYFITHKTLFLHMKSFVDPKFPNSTWKEKKLLF